MVDEVEESGHRTLLTMMKIYQIHYLKSSINSLDTAKSGTGDHENYFVQLNLAEYLMVHTNGSFLNAECESEAVRIRPVNVGTMWPNIKNTTLLFSSKSTFNTEGVIEGDISFHDFHKAVKPNYG